MEKQKNKIMPKLLIFNWKAKVLNQTEVSNLILEYQKFKTPIVVAPPYVFLTTIKDFDLSSQDVSASKPGAFTGEVTAEMLKNLDVKMCLLGHSERRHVFNETDKMVADKMRRVLENNLTPVLCVGETWEERQNNFTQNVVKRQLDAGLLVMRDFPEAKLIVAYEPVWAIGTGKADEPKDSLVVIKYIRNLLQEANIKEYLTIYGGSVSSKNILDFLIYSEIEGALIGSAGVDIEDIKKMLQIF